MKSVTRYLKPSSVIMVFALLIPGPVLATLTFFQMSHIQEGTRAPYFETLLAVDLVYLFTILAFTSVRLFGIFRARRIRRAGARLQVRLALFFTAISLVPTIIAAIFAILTINVGLEGWFSEKVRKAISASLAAAQAYKSEQQEALIDDATKLAVRINIVKKRRVFVPAGDLRNILEAEQSAVQRGLKEAYIIDGTGEIRARGARSYLFDYEKPGNKTIKQAQNQGTQLIEDWPNSELRVLLRLDAFIDRYLYVSRIVDSKILALLDEAQETVRFYQKLETNRNQILLEYLLLYLGVAANIVIAATWFGLWIAEHLSKRVGSLAEAAREVGRGNFDVRIDATQDHDEISTLGKIFNQMTEELSGQRKGLLDINRESEKSRRFFDSVLSNISAGVIGLDSKGRFEFINQTAQESLGLKAELIIGQQVENIIPEFISLLKNLKADPDQIAEEQIRFARHRYIDDFFVRARARKSQRGTIEGYVLALDNITELVLAQRMAAWGDVARRIAHEIKNPLTPIRLAAEPNRKKMSSFVILSLQKSLKGKDIVDNKFSITTVIIFYSQKSFNQRSNSAMYL